MFWRFSEYGSNDQPCYFIVEAASEADARDEYEDYFDIRPREGSAEPVTFTEMNLHDYMVPEVKSKWEEWEREQAELAAHPTLF